MIPFNAVRHDNLDNGAPLGNAEGERCLAIAMGARAEAPSSAVRMTSGIIIIPSTIPPAHAEKAFHGHHHPEQKLPCPQMMEGTPI